MPSSKAVNRTTPEIFVPESFINKFPLGVFNFPVNPHNPLAQAFGTGIQVLRFHSMFT